MFVKIVVNTVVPIVVIVAGVSGAKSMIAARPQPAVEPVVERPTLVQVQSLEGRRVAPRVTASGTVVAGQQTTIMPEVAGRLMFVHPSLVAGGIVTGGDELLRIDAASYRISVAERETEIATAQANLALEMGRREVAQREWELFEQTVAGASGSRELATREPQLQSAQVAIEAAEVRLQRARLDLARTTIRAPWDGVVLNENVEMGLMVSQASQLVTLVGTGEFWVQAVVPVEELSQLQVPGYNSDQASTVTVVERHGDVESRRPARILRVLPEMDPVGRLARVLVAVEDPLLLTEASAPLRASGVLPLLLGSYVDVEFEASAPVDVVPVQRSWMRDGSTAWVMGPDNRLQVRALQVGWSSEGEVMVLSGLASGDRVVTSYIETPVDGMALQESGAQAPAAAAAVDGEGSDAN